MNSLLISPQKRVTHSALNGRSVPITSVIVHELRNPLCNIMLTVHLLESRILDDSDRTYLEIIKRSSVKMNDLINYLLKGQEEKEIQEEKCSLHQLLDEVIEIAKDRITLKNIVIRKDYAPHDLKIKIDKPKIKIALTNIVVNAIDAIGSENGELKFGTKLIRGRHALLIQDNGIGISKENLPFIFNPYFTNKPGGVGVGLAVTKDILLSNQISVKVESMIGHGTRFILLFEKSKSVARRRNLRNHQTVSRNKSLARVVCMG